jgi:hypothetical protein
MKNSKKQETSIPLRRASFSASNTRPIYNRQMANRVSYCDPMYTERNGQSYQTRPVDRTRDLDPQSNSYITKPSETRKGQDPVENYIPGSSQRDGSIPRSSRWSTPYPLQPIYVDRNTQRDVEYEAGTRRRKKSGLLSALGWVL